MGNYSDMLKRLQMYRKSMGLFQKQLAQKLGISQEQYSYLENGITKLSSKNMKALSQAGFNIDFLISGEEFNDDNSELDKIESQFESAEEKNFVLKIVAEVVIRRIENNYGIHEKLNIDNKYVELLKAFINEWDDFSMVGYVRKNQQISQIEMAQKLGVGIKKYRDIEREKRYPDAELLFSLYSMSGYQPMLFLDICDRKLLVIRIIWNELSANERKNILQFMEYIKPIL